jgi:hypothetical protein
MRIVYKLLPFLTLLILSIAFFNKTLTGSEFFVTPDFGGSDILMAEYPAKFFLAESLKQSRSKTATSPCGIPKLPPAFRKREQLRARLIQSI